MPDNALPVLEKCPTGITGFDDICGGGLPRGRPTLLSGHAGSGKSLFALEFVLHGVEEYGEHGVFVSFEESLPELATNVASLGFDLTRQHDEGRIRFVTIDLDPHDMVESGEFDLEGLFLRLGAAADAVGAKRIALDGVENLFGSFSDLSILRAEFRRLMAWLKARGLSAVITTERGEKALSRHGLEEYIADCVVALDHRIDRQLATRRLRIVKYRGSAHGGDEYPFVLDSRGFSVMPITSVGLGYEVSSERVSSGIPDLDAMIHGGFYRGCSILISGTSGTGKSSISAHMVDAACARGERALYVALEESPLQIERNMRSIGLDLGHWRNADMLRFHAIRPTANGLESHLSTLTALVDQFDPQVVIIDPISAFGIGVAEELVKLMLIRAVDLFKSRGITSLFTSLTSGAAAEESTDVGLSSLVDVWLLLRNLEAAGERTRGLYVCKSRGMSHSNQIREFLLTDDGIQLEDIVLDDNGRILTGSARTFHQRQTQTEERSRNAEIERRRAVLERKRQALAARIAIMEAELEDEALAMETEIERESLRSRTSGRALDELATQRSNTGEQQP